MLLANSTIVSPHISANGSKFSIGGVSANARKMGGIVVVSTVFIVLQNEKAMISVAKRDLK